MTLFNEETVAPPSPQLNEGQQKSYNDVLDFLTEKRPEKLIWVLKGYAGTGKTFLLTKIVGELRRRHEMGVADFRVAMSAPTHKAVRVMKKFSSFAPNSVHFATIHSLLGLKAEIDDRGREKFVESKDPGEIRIEQFNVVFLDEVSMLADEIFVSLLKHVRRGLKVIFVGDPVQIPPVNHLDAIPLKEGSVEKYQLGISELTQIMRQAGENPILALATMIRMGYKSVPHFLMRTSVHTDMTTGKTGVDVIEPGDDDKIDHIIMDYFCTKQFQEDPDHMKIIAWQNKTVDEFNRSVRKRIYATEMSQQQLSVLPAIMPREKLIMDKPLVMESGRILLTTNEEIEVTSYEIKDAKIDFQTAEKVAGQWGVCMGTAIVKYYNTQISFFDAFGKKVTANIRILHESEDKRLNDITQSIADAANSMVPGSPLKRQLWKSFYSVKRLFAQVKYNYAVTAHKSQGSTYNNVLVLDWDLSINRRIEERNRIRYVAITRARCLAMIQK